jgi:hypothetical protein
MPHGHASRDPLIERFDEESPQRLFSTIDLILNFLGKSEKGEPKIKIKYLRSSIA